MGGRGAAFDGLQAAKSRDDLIAYYQRARQAMNKAAADVRRSAVAINRKSKYKVLQQLLPPPPCPGDRLSPGFATNWRIRMRGTGSGNVPTCC